MSLRFVIVFGIVFLIQGCSSTPEPQKKLQKPDISGIILPVLESLHPKEINFKVFDQRKMRYSVNLTNLVPEYRRILRETFKKSGFRVSRRASNGISFYVREEQGRNRKRLKHCVYVSGRLRSRSGHWINVGTSECKDNALNEEQLYRTYLSLFKENLNKIFTPMNEKIINLDGKT